MNELKRGRDDDSEARPHGAKSAIAGTDCEFREPVSPRPAAMGESLRDAALATPFEKAADSLARSRRPKFKEETPRKGMRDATQLTKVYGRRAVPLCRAVPASSKSAGVLARRTRPPSLGILE